ncbi:hypothetical protein KCU65_g480, partial [Aureobasidium melanogenum]
MSTVGSAMKRSAAQRAFVESEEEVEVVGLRLGADNFGNTKQTTVLLFHLNQLGLQRFNWLRSVVEQVDAQLVTRIDNLLESIYATMTMSRIGRRSSGVGNSPQVLTLIAAALASRSGEIPKNASMTKPLMVPSSQET